MKLFKNQKGYFDYYFNYLKKIDKKKNKILHIGSGWDKRKINEKIKNAKIFSLDIDFEATKKNNNILKINANAEKMPFKARTFDFIICEELMEHVKYPDKLLNEVFYILKEKGEFIVVTPNGWSYIAILSKLTPLWFHKYYNKLRGIEITDVYKTYYKFNSIYRIKKYSEKFNYTLKELKIVTGTASYFSFIKPIYYFVSFLHFILSKVGFLNRLFGINFFLCLKKLTK